MSRTPRISRRAAAVAVTVALAGGAAACGPTSGDAGAHATPHKGGTLTVLNQAPQDNFDPARLYTTGGGDIPSLVFRTLTTRERADGAEGTKVVPDLATDTGEPSQNATVWTYHLKSGLKFQDGTPITSADIKYGIERSFAPELSGGPPYFRDWLVGAENYQGPYKDKHGLDSVATPNASTIVFHLTKPEGDFPYLATMTQFSPVPKAKDTGDTYYQHPVSSGPYEVTENQNNGTHLVFKRNPYWSAATDSQRKAYPDVIDVQAGLDPAVINQRLETSSGQDADAVTTDTNLGPAELAKINGDKELKSRVGTGHFGQTYYLAFNPKVKPFDNLKVREAISYAINRTSVVNAAGGSSLAEPATTFLPNQATFGYTPYDWFPAGATGNPAKARQLLKEAGYPHGLTITLASSTSDASYQGPAIATAVQDGLKAAGITVRINQIQDDSYSSTVDSVKTEPGVYLGGWGADWPSGGPFLAPIFDGRQIVTDGSNFNNAQLNDAQVNATIDRINAITDHARAAKEWGALDEQLGRQALTVPLFHPVYERLYGKNIRNVVISDWDGRVDVADVAVK
ncbi:ABC transporter substrate-binding protein [Streptomyces sp. ICBB 8177]|uniref:ABC transporter substrate-binding protein n=1 Tax=Streptomyces sp. ICBB 8177 TaxID=563922 RepID=UPI000D67B093|nr:ABC transporter substrate-binding protein [Streptomyces sp. ICBB 8177]PWI43989.1 ABC transporter substrate-binding protein [Streptomyces sp. ICBB 8177]